MELSRRYRLSDAFPKFYESLNMGHFSKERSENNHLSAQALGVPGLDGAPRPQRASESQDEAQGFSLVPGPPEVMCVQYSTPSSVSLFSVPALCSNLGLGK